MSERNSASCPEALIAASMIVSRREGLDSLLPDCSFGSPLQASGEAQRDERELDQYGDIDIPAVARQSGIEEEIAAYVGLDDESGALVPLQLETRGVTAPKRRNLQSELWCRQTVHKFAIAAKLREFGREQTASELEFCHSEVTWATCKGCSKSKRFLNRCERFYCPECQPSLSRDRERSIGWYAARMQQPKHVVLTLKNFPRINKRVVKWAKKCFDRLRRRKFAKNWTGGFYNWEVTKEVAGTMKNGHIMSGGWHLHVHALVEARYIDMFRLSEEWAKVTRGLGRIVDVKDARQHSYLKEVTKYAVKGNQLAAWSGSDIAMFIDAFTGVRTFGVFGELYGKRTEWREWIETLSAKAGACECGCSEFWYQSEWEYETSGGTLLSEGTPRGPTPLFAQLAFSTL